MDAFFLLPRNDMTKLEKYLQNPQLRTEFNKNWSVNLFLYQKKALVEIYARGRFLDEL